MMRIGVTGIGSIGARHARVLASLPGVEVVAHDAQAHAQEIEARTVPGIEVAGSLAELLERAPGGVVIATPDEHHLAALAAAADAGVPALVEKPLAADVAAGRAALSRLDPGYSARVLVGYVLHHYPCMQRANDLITSGGIGAPISFAAAIGAYETLVLARNRFTAEHEGRLFVDYSHEWDYVRWLLSPITGGLALAREAGEFPLSQRPNVVDAVLRLADGTTGTVHLDYVQDPPRRDLVVLGDGGRLIVDVPGGQVAITDRKGAVTTFDDAVHRDVAFTAQARHFLDVATGRTPPAVDVTAALAALEVADALRRSAASGSWVDVGDPR